MQFDRPVSRSWLLYSTSDLFPGPTAHPPRSPKVHHPTEPTKTKIMCRKFRLFAAWLLANLAIFVSAFFVILYSMEWGADVSNAWLLSYVMSFITNAFFADPCKVSILKECSYQTNFSPIFYSEIPRNYVFKC